MDNGIDCHYLKFDMKQQGFLLLNLNIFQFQSQCLEEFMYPIL